MYYTVECWDLEGKCSLSIKYDDYNTALAAYQASVDNHNPHIREIRMHETTETITVYSREIAAYTA